MPEEITSIYQALAAVQSELKAPKGQFNRFGKYNYRSCEDILEAVKPILAKHGLTLVISDEIVNIPSTHALEVVEMTNSEGKKSSTVVGGDRFYIKAEATVWDDSGELISVSAWARESQNKSGMDDSQITGSTSSYARKYALNGLFLIDDTKDADSNENHDQADSSPAKPAPQSAPRPAAASKPSGEDAPCDYPGCSEYCSADFVGWSKREFGKTYCRKHSGMAKKGELNEINDPKENLGTMSTEEENALYQQSFDQLPQEDR